MSLFKKVLWGHITVISIALLILSTLLTVILEKVFYMNEVRELRKIGVPLAQQTNDLKPVDSKFIERLDQLLRYNHIYLMIVDQNNQPIFAGKKELAFLPMLKDVFQQNKHGKVVEGQSDWGKRTITWIMVPRGSGESKGAIILFSPVQGMLQALRRTQVVIWIVAGIALVVSSVISRWFSTHLVQRIQRLRALTKEIHQGNFQTRIKVKEEGADEITALALDFNQMAEHLSQTHEELNRFEQNRRQFIMDLSHELRTPLTSIRGWIEALQKDYIPQSDRMRVYQSMKKEIERLIRLIYELMDLEKIRSGKIELKKETHYIRDLFELVIDQLDWMAEEKGIALNMELPEEDELVIYGDYDRLLQVLVNLVKNGIQFTDQGEVRMGAKQEKDQTLIWVRDTGVGLDQEALKHIWERFFKVDPSRARYGGETGLGLAIVKQLVEAHGGQIEVESQPGAGSTFYLRFPLSPANHISVQVLS